MLLRSGLSSRCYVSSDLQRIQGTTYKIANCNANDVVLELKAQLLVAVMPEVEKQLAFQKNKTFFNRSFLVLSKHF